MARFGRYRLVRWVGSGGMAEVWKARVEGLAGFDKAVAIKRILPEFENDHEYLQMFVSEARLAARLVHPNIVQGYDFGLIEEDGHDVHYLAMEYIAGQNLAVLQARLSDHGRALPLRVALYICSEAAKALAYAHSELDTTGLPLGFVHRDISPHNLMISYQGDIKVTDFGIAKAATSAMTRRTAPGVFRGKVAYMSPEQAACEQIDARSDLFSLGVVLYEMVTGTRLFSGSLEEVLSQVRGFEPRGQDLLAGLPVDVQSVIGRALAARPSERYQSAAELQRDLDGIIAARGWLGARAELAATMRGEFAAKIARERQDANPQQMALAYGTAPVPGALEVGFEATAPSQHVDPRGPSGDLSTASGGKAPDRDTLFTWSTDAARPRATRSLVVVAGAGLLLLLGAQAWTPASPAEPRHDVAEAGSSEVRVTPVTSAVVAEPPTFIVELGGVPEGALVLVNGKPSPGTRLELPDDGHARLVEVRADGRKPWRVLHPAANSARYEVHMPKLALLPQARPEADPQSSTVRPRRPPTVRPSRKEKKPEGKPSPGAASGVTVIETRTGSIRVWRSIDF